MHGIGIARIVFGVFEIGFVEDDEDALRNVPVKRVEFLAGEDGAGGIVRIGQIDDFGAFR